jgi:hypothetical protein
MMTAHTPITGEPAISRDISPEQCRWRVPLTNSANGDAACRLLQQLLGAQSGTESLVSTDICSACCASFRPTFEMLNPVVASLVYERAATLVDARANPVVSERLHTLRLWAEQQLEIDCPQLPVPQGKTIANGATQAARRPLLEMLPAPTYRCGEAVRQWSVGVTTAPRRRNHLDQCLSTLAEAGWPRPYLFADGAANVPADWSHLPTTIREELVGAWPNYYLSLIELLMREPLADAYMLVQDDAVFYCEENVREYLEQILWPGNAPGIVSLYCATPDARKERGWFSYDGVWKYGAVAFIFPREIAQRLVIAPTVFGHRWSTAGDSCVGIPDVLAAWADANSIPFYYCSPSLVQHVGQTSSIWLGAHELTPARRADVCLENSSSDGRPVSGRLQRISRRLSPEGFPESAFPPLSQYEDEYRRCVALGQRRTAEASVVICGLCRDVAPILPATISRVEELASRFGKCAVLVYENDSTDGTEALLRDWAASNSEVRVVSESLRQPKINYGTSEARTQRMAYYRNRCRQCVLDSFSDFEFVIVIDMDLAGGWSCDGIANTFGHDDWDFVGANGMSFRTRDDPQTFEFFDTFAFRADRPISRGQAAGARVPMAPCFVRGEPFFPVRSCFGGLGVYRMDGYRSATYDGADCEHVTFHAAMRERGFSRLFLNPSQIVLYTAWDSKA